MVRLRPGVEADARVIERNPKTTQAFVNVISVAPPAAKASTDEIVAAVPPGNTTPATMSLTA